MAYDPATGSVAAWIQSDNASVITVSQSSIAVNIISGSVSATFTPPANQSVSGTVGASVIGNVNTTITSVAMGLGVFPILSNNTLTPADGNNYAIQEAMGSGGNQLALTVGNYGFNYNGSNWDRVRGNSSIGTLVSTGASSVITVTTFPANQSVSGTIGASVIGNVPVVVQGSVATVIIGGSIAASFTPPANQSVSGSVGIVGNPSISGTVLVNNGSVVAFQGTNPWTVTSSIAGGIFPVSGSVSAVVTNTNLNVSGSVAAFVVGNSSIITVAQSSVAVAIVSGSIAATFTPPANQSVSGSVGIVGNPSISGTVLVNNGSVVAFQGTNPWIVTSSIAGGIFPISGSVAAYMAGSWSASVVTVAPANQSVSGSVGIVGNPSISGTVLVNNGSVVAFQGGAWSASVIGSVAAYQSGTWNVFVAGSVATVGTAAANQSVSGTVGASIVGQLPAGTAVLGSVAVLQGTTPWLISSVYGNISGSIAGTYTSSTVATTVTGLAVMFKPNVSTSIMTEVSPTWPLPITGAVAASISGTVATTLSGNPSISGTVLVNNGSVVAFQGTSPWVVNFQNSSVVAIPTGSVIAVLQSSSIIAVATGSVVAVPTGNQSVSGTVITISSGSIAAAIVSGSIAVTVTPPANQSVSGTVGASIIGQLPAGTAPLGSVATLQGTVPWIISSVYGNISGSVAAFVVGNASVITVAQGSVAAVITGTVNTVVGSSVLAVTTPYTGTASWLSGTASLFTGVVQPLLGSITGSYTYMTGLQVANGSANNVYISLYGQGLSSVVGGTSILAYTVAPANGGSNIVFQNALRTSIAGALISASVSGVASVFLSAQGFYAAT